jgi:2'-5' RNA ligase
MKRCFIALGLEKSALEAALRLQAEIKKLPDHAAKRIRLAPKGNLHMTLKFLGDVAEDMLPKVKQSLSALAQGWQRTAIELRGVSAFPSAKRPKSVFAAIAQGAQASALMQQTDAAMGQLGFATDAKARIPHVTLARINQPQPGGPLSQWLSAHRPASLGDIDTSAIILYQNVLEPSGAIYTPMERFETGT